MKCVRGVLALIAAIVVLAVSQGFAQTAGSSKPGKADPLPTDDKERIEKIVHDYLIKNPSVIREAIEVLQAQEAQEKEQAAAKNIKALRPQIFSDPLSPVVGNPKGDVTVVVFFDYNCGYCKKSLPELAVLISKDPQLRVVYKEFPILGPGSQAAARAALAADRQGKYSVFHDALFKAPSLSEVAIKGIADRSGLNYEQLQKDIADPKLGALLDQNYALATALHIEGTPAYIVGDQLIPGAIDMDSLKSLIDEERSKLAAVKPSQNAAAPNKH
jgi:protein-disulfide isomerase